jgi:hypothetical protein
MQKVLSIFLSIFLVSGCSSHSDSYDLGVEVGKNALTWGQSIESYCANVIDLAKGGTPNDGIDWQAVNRSEFIQGCIAGHKG